MNDQSLPPEVVNVNNEIIARCKRYLNKQCSCDPINDCLMQCEIDKLLAGVTGDCIDE